MAANTPAIDAAFARQMAPAATFIEIAVAEKAVPIPRRAYFQARLQRSMADARTERERLQATQAYQRELSKNESLGDRITYRVERRLKGAGPARFYLDGDAFASASEPSRLGPLPGHRSHFTPGLGGPVPLPIGGVEVTPSTQRQSRDGACGGTHVLEAVLGQRYLIFRNAAGRLLGPTMAARPGGPPRITGYVYEPIAGPNDPWVKAVEKAVRAPTARGR
jgi:hypothetical protein